MKLTITTPILAALCLAFATKAQNTQQGTGFRLQMALDVDTTLMGNTDIIGAHLHSGSATVNGPVNVIFCGSAPLPSNNGPCVVSDVTTENDNRTKSLLDVPSSLGAWSNGINNATAVPGATTLEDGAPTTYESFVDTLLNKPELLYLNVHTNYSFTENPGYGLERSQLRKIECPPQENKNTLCFGVEGDELSSINTNKIKSLANALPDNAGKATPVDASSPMIVYVPPSPSMAPSGLRGLSDEPTTMPTSGASSMRVLTTVIGGAAWLALDIVFGH